jgi:hypothetical protein
MNMDETVDIGDSRGLKAVIKDANGTPVDPLTLTFEVGLKDGIPAAYVYGEDAAVVRDATGVYHLDFTFPRAGVWAYRVQTTGPDLAESRTIVVKKSPFAS